MSKSMLCDYLFAVLCCIAFCMCSYSIKLEWCLRKPAESAYDVLVMHVFSTDD